MMEGKKKNPEVGLGSLREGGFGAEQRRAVQ